MVVQGFGDHELRYTRGGVVLRRRDQRRGKGNLCALFSYCERLLGRRIELMDLAQRREKWRRLAKSL
jgi:hypothetical protein